MSIKFRTLNVKPRKNDGSYLFSNFDIGLYLLDTPRGLGEQLGSLALIGGRNIITERGALVPQYGYEVLGKLDKDEYVAAITKDSYSASSFFIVTQLGHVYLYTAYQGLKKYKTSLGTVTNPVVTHSGKHMVIFNEGQLYLFGSHYNEGHEELINGNITISDYDIYYQFTVPLEYAVYYWNGKELSITGTVAGASKSIRHVVSSVVEDKESNTCIIRTLIEGEHVVYETGTVSIYEKTIIEKDRVYTPEDKALPQQTMNPELMSVCANRLFIVDITGRIYYSQVGGVEVMANSTDPENVDGFHEAYGAGYFEGFYSSTSKTLSIEDFMNGALIAKQDGLYYLTLSSVSSSNVGAQTDDTINYASITKIANIGQAYAQDHVIVGEQVYAYDTYTGSIVNALSVNIFGNMVAGNTIIDAKALASQSSGIDSSRRALVYNGQENTFFLYYGPNLDNGILLTLSSTIFPRKLDLDINTFIGFNQGVVGVTDDGTIIQDYKVGTTIKDVSAYADFEAIGLRDNRFICSSIIEVTELNGVNYTVSTKNAGGSSQKVVPLINYGTADVNLPPLIYSDKRFGIMNDSFELTSRWADKKSNITRLYAPMSGREGVQISIEFQKNTSFCLAALRLPDFSQGE